MKSLLKSFAACAAIVTALVGFVGSAGARTMTVESENVEKGRVVSVTLSFDTANETNSLFVAYGAADGGTTREGWDGSKWQATIFPETTSLVVPVPDGWGLGVKAMRFFLSDGTEDPILWEKTLEYVASNGKQWIDTGLVSKSTISTELDFCITNASNTGACCIFGERQSASSNHKYVFWMSKSGGAFHPAINFGAKDSGYKTAYSTSERCKLRNENCDLYWNDTCIYDSNDQTFTSDWHLMLFTMATAQAGTSVDNRGSHCLLWGAKMWDGGVLQRNFVPCVKDGVPCLFEKVEKKFYPSTGSAAFIAGPEIYSEPEDVVLSTVSRAVIAVDLPSAATLSAEAKGDGTATIAGEVVFANGGEGDLMVSYGTSEDALTETACLQAGLSVGDVGRGTISGLAPRTVYYYKLFMRTPGGDLAPTMVGHLRTPSAGAQHRDVVILSQNREGSSIVSVTLGFSTCFETNILYCLSGQQDGGDDPADWESREQIALVRPGADTLTVPVPEGWSTTVFAMRFVLSDGTENHYKFDTALDFIEMDGRQYVDTGLYPDKTMTLKGTWSHVDQTHDMMLFGARSGGYNFICWFNDTKKRGYYSIAPCIGTSGNLSDNRFSDLPLGGLITIEYGESVGLVVTPDGGEPRVVDTPETFAPYTTTATSTRQLALFALHDSISFVDDRKFYGKFYGGEIRQGGDLVRKYQPCVAGGVAGLWDFCEDKFVSATSDFQFIAGNPIKLEPRGGVTFDAQTETISLASQPIVLFTGVTPNDDGSVTADWEVLSLGSGDAADILAVWGGAADSMFNTNLLASAQALGAGSADLVGLAPGRTYYLHLLAKVGETLSDPSAVLPVTTTVPDSTASSRFFREVKVAGEVRTGGLVTAHTLAFEPLPSGTFALYRVFGARIGGAGTNGWETVEKVADVPYDTTSLEVSVPEGWGTTVRYLRYCFILDAAAFGFQPVEYLSSVNQNASSPMYIDTGVKLAYGETLVVQWAQAALTGLTNEDKGWGASSSTYGLTAGGRRRDNYICAFYHGDHRRFQPQLHVNTLDTETVYVDTAVITDQTWVEMTGTDGSVRESPRVNTPNGENWNSGNNLMLFKDSHPSSPHPGKKRIYGASLRNDLAGAAVLKLVPGVKDDVAGFYDFVSGEFLTNAGAGTFEVGAAVEVVTATELVFAEDATLPSVGTFAVTDVSEGDALTVAGQIGSAGGDTATVQVEVSRTGDFTDAVAWSAATDLASGGEWSIRLHSEDTQAADYIVPGAEVSVRVRVVSASGKSDVSDPQTATTLRESALGTVGSSAVGRTLTVTAPIASLGANTTYVWIDWTQGVASGTTEKKVYPQGAATDSAVWTFPVPDWTTVSCTVHCSNDCATAAWDIPVAKNVAAVDNATYTWKNAVTEGDWNNPENWTSSNPDDCLGWPQTDAASAKFDGAVANVHMPVANRINNLSFAGVFDLTFDGGTTLNVGSISVEKKDGWKIRLNGCSIISDGSFTSAGDLFANNCLISVRGTGSEFGCARFALGGVSNRYELVDGGCIFSHGSTMCFGGEANEMILDNGTINGRAFDPGDITPYTTMPPKVVLRGENAAIQVWYGIGSFKNPNMVATDWVFEVPVNGYANVPLMKSVDNEGDIFPRERDSGSEPAKSGWQRFTVSKDSPFVRKGKGTVDHPIVFWKSGINTNRVELTKLPNGGEWFFTYGTDMQNPLAEPADEGDMPTGIWARLSAHSGTMLIVR